METVAPRCSWSEPHLCYEPPTQTRRPGHDSASRNTRMRFRARVRSERSRSGEHNTREAREGPRIFLLMRLRIRKARPAKLAKYVQRCKETLFVRTRKIWYGLAIFFRTGDMIQTAPGWKYAVLEPGGTFIRQGGNRMPFEYKGSSSW